MLSKHIVGLSSGVASVSGELVVNTELSDMDDFMACLAEDSTAADAGVSVTAEAQANGEKAKIRIKTWAADGSTAGTGPTLVRWWAHGR